MNSLAHVTATAIVPDQLLPYVHAISGLESSMAGECLAHYGGDKAVLVAYPPANPADATFMDDSLHVVLERTSIKKITVLSASVPQLAPAHATISRDFYWKLDLPLAPPKGKLGNLLKRAQREITVVQTGWSPEHSQLSLRFSHTKNLDEGTQYLFEHLGDYVRVPTVEIYSAYSSNNTLKAFAIGDFSAMSTAFYMFACRDPDATPGTSDLLLYHLINRANELGYATLNLGLGISPEIEFFKRKWGAVKFIPYIETSWDVKREKKESFWKRLFGKT